MRPTNPSRIGHGLFLLLAACNSMHEAAVTEDGQLVARMAPIPYRVLVEPVRQADLLTTARAPDQLGFALAPQAFEDRLRRALRDDLALASAVIGGDADPDQFDLRLRITVDQRPTMAYHGTTGGNVSAVLAWLCTILGGSCIDDCRYRVAMPMKCDLLDARGEEVLYRFAVDPKYVDTEYWDRVTPLGGLLWAFSCLPHCLVSDNVAVTSASLSEKGTDILAAAIAKQMKISFERGTAAFPRIGRVEFVAPRIGVTTPAASLRLECTIHTPAPLREVIVYLGSRTERTVLHLEEDELRLMTQPVAGGYVAHLDLPLPVLDHPALRLNSDNALQVRIKAGNIDATRTLRVVLE